MIKFRRLITIFVLAFSLASCSGLLYTSIDVLRPAQVAFPTTVNEVAVINNTIAQPHSLGHQNDLFDKNETSISIDTDSLPVFALASFIETMQDTEFFAYVDFNFNLDSENTSRDFNTLSLLSQYQVDSLYDKHGVDALVVLNRLAVKDQLGELYDMENGTFLSYLEAHYEYNWSIHLNKRRKAFSLVTRDTVYWEAENYSRKRSIQEMPDRRDALIDGALISGARAVNHFIPFWEKEDRYFFKLSGKQFNAGLDALYNKDWDEAIELWEQMLLKTKNSHKKTKLAHNISVLYEIKSDVEKALDYSNQSIEILAELMLIDFNKYMIILKQNEVLNLRLAHHQILNQQLGISD